MLNIKNNSKTTLSSEITSDATEMTVANASLLPNVPCRVTIDNEILEITAKNGNICSISRGKEGTTPSVHSANSEVRANITVDVFNDIKYPNISPRTYGETIAVNDALYLKTSDGKVYKTNANFNDERIHNFIGFAKEAGNANDVKLVQTNGVVSGFSGLDINCPYFLSNTVGAISSTPGTNYCLCGFAVSQTELIIDKINRIAIPSDTIRQANTTKRGTYSTSYVKMKEIKVVSGYLSLIRIVFTLGYYGSGTGGTYYGCIYKNGSPIGTERSVGVDGGTFTEDLGPFKKDDLIQIYGKQSSGATNGCGVWNFYLCFDEKIITENNFINQDP